MTRREEAEALLQRYRLQWDMVCNRQLTDEEVERARKRFNETHNQLLELMGVDE